MHNLAVALSAAGRHAEAEPWQRRVLSGLDGFKSSMSKAQLELEKAKGALRLGKTLKALKRPASAEDMYRQALKGFGVDIEQAAAGVESADTSNPDVPPLDLADALNGAAFLLRLRKQTFSAISMFKRALAIYEKTQGKHHIDTLTACANLATALDEGEDPAAAEGLARRALEGYSKLLGPSHQTTLQAKNNVAFFSARQGKMREAAEMAMDVQKQDDSVLMSSWLETDDGEQVAVSEAGLELDLNFASADRVR